MKRANLISRITERMDLPGERLPMQTLVELCGDSRVLIEHYSGISEYCTDRISVNVRYGKLGVFGDGLQLRRMSGCQLVICGKIEKIVVTRK